jgi:hypothetical protein
MSARIKRAVKLIFFCKKAKCHIIKYSLRSDLIGVGGVHTTREFNGRVRRLNPIRGSTPELLEKHPYRN